MSEGAGGNFNQYCGWGVKFRVSAYKPTTYFGCRNTENIPASVGINNGAALHTEFANLTCLATCAHMP